MLSREQIGNTIAKIRTALDGLAAGTDDLDRCREVDDDFEALRSQYRSSPETLADGVEELAKLRNRFDELLRARAPAVVDRFHALNQELDRAGREKEFWRGFLIRLAESERREHIGGAAADVRVRSTVGRRMPPPQSEGRQKLEQFVRAAGRWEAVSQLSRPKLERALANGQFAPPIAGEIEALCPTEVRHMVSCTPRVPGGQRHS
ncbi:MAG: hypothetical protein ABII12_13140 [Planctomycetota bacterium]